MNKKELEKNKRNKKQEKQKRKENRKINSGDKSFDNMIAYVDENGIITDTPPDPKSFTKIEAESITISTPKKEEIEDSALTGQVEFFNQERGYGFIKDVESTEKYFFHINNAPASIKEGNMVSFESERGQKGMSAVNITIIK
ncbi:MAG: cold shock domain-containing protein [Bacteroidota bacterium]|nr:cold shock domain-containing protein [Bacteroidota bacterium]